LQYVAIASLTKSTIPLSRHGFYQRHEIQGELLAACIQQWFEEIGREVAQHIAIDGKTLRGAKRLTDRRLRRDVWAWLL